MAILRMLASALLMAGAATVALAQTGGNNNTTVYKCKNADGSVVYSHDPCSSDPNKMETLDTSGALRTGSGGHQNEIAASVADSDCRDKAYKSTHGSAEKIAESNQHIADYRQQREALQSEVNYAGAGSDPAMRKSVDDLDAAIARESEFQQKEQANSEQAYHDALHACDTALKK
jgi:hypothetical protein